MFFELSGAEQKQFARSQTENVEAYEKYLRGRFYQNQNTEHGLTKAVEFYEQAIALDRGFAAAHTGLADALLILYNFGLRPPDEIIPKAKQSLNRALHLKYEFLGCLFRSRSDSISFRTGLASGGEIAASGD